ncbi:MAG: hypothetical protein LBU04_08185, partial [Christensenellaceae bacterium]|nr:hypothetical protein [Christensenellaceae bacterium]
MKSLLIKFTKASFLFAFIFVCLFMFLVSFNNSYDNNGLVANAVETKMNFHSDSAWTDGSGGNIARKYVADIDLAQGIVPIESNTDDTQTYKKTKSLDDSDIGISIPTFDALSLRNSLWNVLKDAPSNWTETFGYDWHMDPLSERTDNGLPSGTSPNKNNGGWATVSKYAIRDKRIESNDSTAVLQKGVAVRGTNIKQYIQYQFNVSFSDPIIQAAISTNRFKVSLSYSVQFNVISVNETVSGPFGNVEVKHSNDGSGNTFVSSGSFTNTVKASSETSRNASGVAPHASINNNSITFAVEISSVVAGGTHLKGMYFDAIKFTDLKLNFEYTTAKSEFKVDGDNGSGIIDVNGTKTNSNNNTITQYPDLLGQMSEGEKRLTATVTQSANYVFLGWFKNSVLVTHSLTLTTPQPYTFTGDALYTARIKKIMSNDGVSGIVDNQNYTYNQITHGVGSKQGPTGFVNFTTYFDSGGGVYSQIVLLHSYVSSDGGKHNPAQVEINSDDNKTPSNQPKDVGKYRYTVTAVHKTTKNGANSYDSVNVGQLSVEFSIIKYAPDPDLGYAINIPFLNYGINLSQLAIEGSNPVINGVEIDGSYQIDYTGVCYSAASVPTATINAVKVKFVPDDTTNIASITLSGTYTIIFRKAEILFGYFDDKNEFQSGIPTKPGTLTYGQKNEIFMDYVKSTMRLKNPQENVYVDYEVTTNMPLYPVATDEDKTASTTVTFDITKTKIYLKTHYGMTGDIPATDLYTIAVAEKTFQYKVFRANLVFTKIDEFELKFPDNKTTAGNDNVFNMATIT